MLSRQQLFVGTLPGLERTGKFPWKPSLGFTGSAFLPEWVSRPCWGSLCWVISLPSLSSHIKPSKVRENPQHRILTEAFICVAPEPADLVQPVLRVAPTCAQGGTCDASVPAVLMSSGTNELQD